MNMHREFTREAGNNHLPLLEDEKNAQSGCLAAYRNQSCLPNTPLPAPTTRHERCCASCLLLYLQAEQGRGQKHSCRAQKQKQTTPPVSLAKSTKPPGTHHDML
jgi:hypothetical protein